MISVALLVLMTSCIPNDERQDENLLNRAFPDGSQPLNDKVAFVVAGDLYLIRAHETESVSLGAGVYEVAWSPDGQSLLVSLKQPGSNPLFDIAVVSGDNWSTKQYVQKNLVGTWSSGVDWSPEGNRVVYAGGLPESDGSWTFGVYTANQDGTDTQLVASGSAYYCFPAWSPDGSRIALVTSEGVEIVELDSPGVQQLVYPRYPKGPGCFRGRASWFPDSQRLLISEGLNIRVLNLGNNSVSTLLELDAQGAVGAVWAVVLPDGRHVVYKAAYHYELSESHADSDRFHHEVMLADLEDMTWRDITPDVDTSRLSYVFDWWQPQ